MAGSCDKCSNTVKSSKAGPTGLRAEASARISALPAFMFSCCTCRGNKAIGQEHRCRSWMCLSDTRGHVVWGAHGNLGRQALPALSTRRGSPPFRLHVAVSRQPMHCEILGGEHHPSSPASLDLRRYRISPLPNHFWLRTRDSDQTQVALDTPTLYIASQVTTPPGASSSPTSSTSGSHTKVASAWPPLLCSEARWMTPGSALDPECAGLNCRDKLSQTVAHARSHGGYCVDARAWNIVP